MAYTNSYLYSLFCMADYQKMQRLLEALINKVLSDDKPFEYSLKSYNESNLSSVSSDCKSVIVRKKISI